MLGRITDFVRWLLGRIPKSKLIASANFLFYILIRSEQGKEIISRVKMKYPEDEIKMTEDLLIFLNDGILEIAKKNNIWKNFIVNHLRRKILLYLKRINAHGLY